MTADELKTYLDKYRQDRLEVECFIDALNYRSEQIKDKAYIYQVQEEQRQILEVINCERDKIAVMSQVIQSWTELISDEVYRQIFTYRFIDGLKWDEIERKTNYSQRQLFIIVRNCIETITNKTISDLSSGTASEAAIL